MQNLSLGDLAAEHLPPEILLRVFTYLDSQDLVNCSYVCPIWNKIALDPYLWQKKLVGLLSTRWSTIICNQRPDCTPDFYHLQTIHPFNVYLFLRNYVPQYLLGPQALEAEKSSQADQQDVSSDDQVSTKFSGTHRPTFGDIMWSWWHQMRRRFSNNLVNRTAYTSRKKCRFAVFGPGFDQRATSCLFSKLVDSRTRSFEPLNMIPGRMGFGAGLTLRLHNQAQLAVNGISLETTQSDLNRTIPSWETSSLICSSTSEQNQPSDFIFDLHYLYSLSGHLSHRFDSQLERINSSRLFVRTNDNANSLNGKATANLTVSNEMRNLLSKLCGIIYALDARDSAEQISYLYDELNAALQGFPKAIASRIPVAILYIMPKEEIKIKLTPVKRNESNPNLLNRDSYSGADYTISWNGSLLLPLVYLKLFELKNPWRLQKCASNDIKAVIQCLIWLKSQHPITNLQTYGYIRRTNSTS